MVNPASLAPASTARRLEAGGGAENTPRRRLADLVVDGRDPLGILAAQNATRVADLVPLRRERMTASAFAFYRGTAALMPVGLAAGPSSGILVASCGDPHVSNFGFYASPQRTLVFDLNGFDERRGRRGSGSQAPRREHRDRGAVDRARRGGHDERGARRRARVRHVAAQGTAEPRSRGTTSTSTRLRPHGGSKASRRVLTRAIADASRRTTEQAARKLTRVDAEGRVRFIETPPTMTGLDPDVAASVSDALAAYLETTPPTSACC